MSSAGIAGAVDESGLIASTTGDFREEVAGCGGETAGMGCTETTLGDSGLDGLGPRAAMFCTFLAAAPRQGRGFYFRAFSTFR